MIAVDPTRSRIFPKSGIDSAMKSRNITTSVRNMSLLTLKPKKRMMDNCLEHMKVKLKT